MAAILAGGILLIVAWGPLLNAVTPDMAARVRAIVNAGGGAWLDRNGRLLRLFPDADENVRLVRPGSRFPLVLRNAMLTAEDRRFFQHGGFDPLAIARAVVQNLKGGRVISGASTITQQLVRLSRPRRRTFWNKLTELILAVKLERQMKKPEILTAYLNLAPMGGNLRGAGIASLLWFGKDVRRVNLAEAATLAAFPQSPTRLDPRRPAGRKRLLDRRNRILVALARRRLVTRSALRAALATPVPTAMQRLPLRGMHFVEWATKRYGKPLTERRTSLDLELQAQLERILNNHRGRLGQSGAWQAAGMIVDLSSREILAMSGSLGYGPFRGGFINGCDIRRSGGSILKPFLYALALESGFDASSVIPDTRRHFRTPQGDYLPENADRRAYGPVTLRCGLGNSLNIAAVKLLNAIGIRSFADRLVEAGIIASDPASLDRFGLGLAIGNPEVRMTDLVPAYAMLANGGRLPRLEGLAASVDAGSRRLEPPDQRQIFTPEAGWITLDMLSDPQARLLTFGNPRFFQFEIPVAIKTGTSTNYRDCWLVAVTRRRIYALWVGNFDGRPTWGLSGAVGCGPILRDLIEAVEPSGGADWFPCPAGVTVAPICGISGESPGPFCPSVSREFFIQGRERLLQPCRFHAQAGLRHELPAEYAEWVEQRQQRGLIDPFTLGGGILPVNPLEAGDLPPMPPGVVLASEAVSAASPATTTTIVASGSLPAAGGSPSAPLIVRSDAAFPEVGPAGRLAIVSPHDGDRFIMVPGGENLVILRAVPSEPVAELIWLIDGQEVARTPPPYTAWWKLSRGVHSVTCVGGGEESAQITIQVE